MKEGVWGIYKITNTENGKVYIGSSRNIYRRLRDHKNLLRTDTHVNPHLQHAYNHYGGDCFTFEIIETLDEEHKTNKFLRDLETEYIKRFDSSNPKKGYNIVKGGRGSIGIPCSDEKKRKISESNKGRIAHNKGEAMSEEQKELLKIVDSEKFGKAVDVYTIEGQFIETVMSVHEVTRKYKSARNIVSASCRGLSVPKRYIFVYHGDDLSIIGSNKTPESAAHKEKRLSKYRINHGHSIDVYGRMGNYIQTIESVVGTASFYSINESQVRSSKSYKSQPSKYIFRNKGDRRNFLSVKRFDYGGLGGTIKYVMTINDCLYLESSSPSDIISSSYFHGKKKYLSKTIPKLRLGEEIKIEDATIKCIPVFDGEDIITRDKPEEVEPKIIKNRYNIIYI